MSVYIGIDPGKHGGFACVDSEKHCTYPWDGDMFPIWIERMVKEHGDENIFAIVEKVSAMPGQGVTSMFNFGKNCGYIEGVLKANYIAYQLIPPKRWKMEYGLHNTKEESIAVCQRLFPDVNLYRTDRCRKPDDGMAEALLMAEYGRRKF